MFVLPDRTVSTLQLDIDAESKLRFEWRQAEDQDEPNGK